MLPKIIRKILTHKGTVLPLWALLFSTIFILPLASSLSATDGLARMNKYDALDDEFSYCSTTMEDLRHFKASYPEAEEASFRQAIDLDGDGAPTLYVTSSFEDPSYGFPYVDGAYIRIPKGLEFAEGHYYSNHPTLTGQISQGGKTYDFGGTMHFDIPQMILMCRIWEPLH